MKLLFILCIVTPLCVFSQNLNKTGVLNVTVRSSGAIVQNDQVRGYYQFYLIDKTDRNNYNYQLTIFDENLREMNSIAIIRPKSYTLIEASFNGEAFAFLFYDVKTHSIEIKAYDKTLAVTGTVKKVIDNKYAMAVFRNASLAGSTSAMLVPVGNKGFLLYGIKSGKHFQYELEYFDNNLASIWVQRVADGSKTVEIASEAFQSKQYVGSLITRKGSINSRDMEMHLLVQDVASGNVIFRTPMQTEKYNLSFSNVFYDSTRQNFIVFGEYFDVKDKELKASSLGFMTLEIDLQGKIQLVKTNSWQNDISKVAPVNEKGKFDGSNTSILFHEIIRTADGKMFVVGEQYKKAANAGGIVGNVFSVALLGQQVVSNVQLNIYNMVIFEFNPDYSLKKLHMFEKDKNVLALPSGYGSLSPRTLSYYARAVGGFDFSFAQVSEDQSTFFVSFVNYNREGGGRAKNTLGTIVYTPEKVFSVDKMVLNRKSTDYYVYRAKEGYVMVTEYFKPEKRLETRLEKVNY